jgi:hypothetical protein
MLWQVTDGWRLQQATSPQGRQYARRWKPISRRLLPPGLVNHPAHSGEASDPPP